MTIAISLHVLAAVIWVGGMFFAHNCLRPPAADLLEPAHRLPLWQAVLGRFFLWVWIAIAVLLVSGYWMVFAYFNGFANVGLHVHIMHGAGLIMIAIFLYVFFKPYIGLRGAVQQQQFKNAAAHLARIRQAVTVNLVIGLLVIVVAAGGRYFVPAG